MPFDHTRGGFKRPGVADHEHVADRVDRDSPRGFLDRAIHDGATRPFLGLEGLATDNVYKARRCRMGRPGATACAAATIAWASMPAAR